MKYKNVLDKITMERCKELIQQLIREKCVMWESEDSTCPQWVEKQLKSMDMDVMVAHVTDAQKTPDRYQVVPNPVIIGTIGKGLGSKLILEAHYDTQFVDLNRWDYDPFGGEEIEGRIYGRGAVDSKGQMAAMFAAIEAIQNSGVELKGQLMMACMPDGEYGGSGWKYVADTGLADDVDYIIGSEATYWVEKEQFQVCMAHYGQYMFTITTIGKPTHFHRPQKEGVDAHWEMEKVINALGTIEFTHESWKWFVPRLNLLSMNSEVYGYGVKCKLAGFVCVVPGMTEKSIRKDFKAILDKVKEEYGKLDYELSVWPRWYPSEANEDSPVVNSLMEATEAVTGKPAFKGVFELVHGGAPAIFSRVNPGKFTGKPEAITFGCGDFRLAHIENEFVEVKNLTDSAKIYASVILDLLT